MAVVKSIVLTGPGATGNNGHTGFGFQPSGGIFASSFLTSVSDSVSVFASIALVDEAGNSICAGYEDNDFQATIDANKVFNTSDTICRLDSAGAQVNVADWVSWDADGITLNWKETSAWKIGCLAFNSADVETEVGTFNLNTSTGNQTVTMSASWTPTAVIFLHAIENTTLGASAHGRMGMGVMTGANQWGWCATDQDNVADSVVKRSFKTDKCFTSHATASAHAVTFEAEFVSMAAGEFTFNLTTAPGAAVTVGYMAIRGINAAAVFPDAKETTGTQAYTGWGMTPLAVLAAGPQFATTDGTIAGTNIASFGASDGTTNWCASTHIEDAAASSNTARDWTETYFWLEISSTGADVVAASTSSFDADGATLNFATTAAGTRYKPIIAFGTSNAAKRRYGLPVLGVG